MHVVEDYADIVFAQSKTILAHVFRTCIMIYLRENIHFRKTVFAFSHCSAQVKKILYVFKRVPVHLTSGVILLL